MVVTPSQSNSRYPAPKSQLLSFPRRPVVKLYRCLAVPLVPLVATTSSPFLVIMKYSCELYHHFEPQPTQVQGISTTAVHYLRSGSVPLASVPKPPAYVFLGPSKNRFTHLRSVAEPGGPWAGEVPVWPLGRDGRNRSPCCFCSRSFRSGR